MKKVLALVLAVMMLATVAIAADAEGRYDLWLGDVAGRPVASVTPDGNIKIDQINGIGAGAEAVTVSGTSNSEAVISYVAGEDGKMQIKDSGENAGISTQDLDTSIITGIKDMLFRSVTNENYSVSSLKVVTGRSLVKGVTINDKEERVEVKFVDDLNNTTAKTWDLTFTLKGKGKMILKDDELAKYIEYTGNKKNAGDRVTIPSVKFKMSGTVGYGKVNVYLGDDTDEDLEDLHLNQAIRIDSDVVKFNSGKEIGQFQRVSGAASNIVDIPAAGSFVADAILTQHYGEAMTMEARVYGGDVLFFGVDNDPDRDIIGRLADSDADMDFYFFNSDTKFTTFNSNVKLYFNDAEENDHVYYVNKDGKLVSTGAYDDDEGCWVVKTRTLGKYIISDVELKEFEAAAGEANPNPDTGANDVVGIATALAAVALVSAAAVSLKK